MSGPFRTTTTTTVTTTGGTDIASGEPLNTTATDKITTAAEAAQFLRQAALGGGTWTEIQNVLALGSRKKWLEGQIFVPEVERLSPINGTGFTSYPDVQWPGYFSNVCRTLFPPRGSSGATAPAFIFPGNSFSLRCLLTAFLNNANEDAGATQFHTAVNSVPFIPVDATQVPSGFDLSETLRLKCTWVLSKFIPCSVPGGAWDATDKTTSIAMWYSLLHRAAFGTYADLLEDVTYSPPMALMLTYIANRKEADGFQPDENYAREIMQLFTIGLYELNIDGTYKLDANGERIQTYDNEDVYQMARVFTGLCRNDFADFDLNKNQGLAFNTWQTGQWPWYYDDDTPDRRNDMSYTPITAGIHNICSYDGNLTFNAVNLRGLVASLSVAIPASGEITTITVTSTGSWPNSGCIKIDDEIFHYESKTATTFNVRAINPGGGLPATRRGHLMSPIQAHPVGRTVSYYRPYWFHPGVSARLRHYIPFYEKGAKYALKGRVNIPANTEPGKNIRMAIEALVAHPSCAPFVCNNLIKYMVTSNPTPGYVARVARVFENDGQGVRGNLGAVWLAILTDPEACNTTQSSQKAGRIRDGFEVYAATVRPFHRISRSRAGVAATDSNSVYINGTHQTSLFTGFLNTYGDIASVGVFPYLSPSIFGYYPPGYSVAPGASWGLITPELGAYSFYTLMEGTNQILNRLVQGEPRDVASATVTITIASPAVVTWTGHSLANNTQVVLTTTGALPTGLVANTTYFVRNATANTFELSTISGGASINTTGTQSPTHTAWTGVMASTTLIDAQYVAVTTSYDPTVSSAISNTADPTALVDRLNILMCGGTLAKSKFDYLVSTCSTAVATEANRQDRITGVAQMMFYATEFYVQ